MQPLLKKITLLAVLGFVIGLQTGCTAQAAESTSPNPIPKSRAIVNTWNLIGIKIVSSDSMMA